MKQTGIDSRTADKTSTDAILKILNTTKSGLSTAEATSRISTYGPNTLEEKKQSILLMFLKGFWGPIPWLIELAALLSMIVKHWEDFIIISILLMANAIIEFVEEYSANNAIAQLKDKLALNAQCLRDGNWVSIAASMLVPGDYVTVSLGDVVPADLKLCEGDYLNIDQSALTGESLTVEKRTGAIAYSGTVVKQGKMSGIVINTGTGTLFGKTAMLIDEARNVSHFQKAVIRVGNFLIITAFVLIAILGIFAYLRGENLLDFASFALVLLVAAIPAALPTVLSVTMVIGVKYLSRKNAIVSHMTAVEEMSGMDVLCSDKTGTLTQNKLTVEAIVPYREATEKKVLQNAVLASDGNGHKDAIDELVQHSFQEKYPDTGLSDYKLKKYIPFDPVKKRAEAVYQFEGKEHSFSKGAPQAIAGLLDDKSAIGFINEKAAAFAKKGYRALAVAEKAGSEWVLDGIFSMYDPPREDSQLTLEEAFDLGIRVKMVTGDQVAIASETAKQIGIGSTIVNAAQLDAISDTEASKRIAAADGFAQVFPEHKFRIVKLLQDENHIVGMTGDGVNDAPALKQANIGIAVDGATDASKSAADLILTGKGISVIIDAIRSSRKIFARMENYTVYRIAETLRILLFITASIIVLKFYPITALMVVLLAILNDVSILTIAYDNVQTSKKPLKWNMHYILSQATVLGVIGVLFTFSCIWFAHKFLHLSQLQLQTLVYLKLSVAGHLTVFLARNRGHFWESAPAKPLWLSILLTQTLAIVFSVYGIILPAGIGWQNAFVVFGFVFVEFFVTDFLKVMLNKKWGYISG
ncbi:MAG: plasma-membrane proton-efflux P-type ATPase [Flavobacteriaceae bacterium]|nr:plasma-membrane proton-efflux P-type ATPase [Flavobacteriaceae bacterium]